MPLKPFVGFCQWHPGGILADFVFGGLGESVPQFTTDAKPEVPAP